MREAILVSDLLPLGVRTMNELPHQWFWDGTEHVDPAKEARAQEMRLKNNTSTLAHEYARQGKDWEAELRQRAREKSLMNELGLLAVSGVEPTGARSQVSPRQSCYPRMFRKGRKGALFCYLLATLLYLPWLTFFIDRSLLLRLRSVGV